MKEKSLRDLNHRRGREGSEDTGAREEGSQEGAAGSCPEEFPELADS